MKNIDTQFYPGWTRKAITFSIDDGNIPMDRKFLEILRPAGIRGSFNLCSHSMNRLTPAEYREFYRGCEVTNHCKYHPFALADGAEYAISDEPFDAGTADPALLYRSDVEHLYHIKKPQGWRMAADTEGYIAFVDACHREVEEVFGAGSVRCYVWPFNRQPNAAVEAYLRSLEKIGYYGVRESGARGAAEGFPLPGDRWPWHYTATHTDFLEKAAQYEAQPDDGTLKFFCLGVHSVDYENAGKWDDLRTFAAQYGSCPQEYWYAPVGEIFDHADAVRRLVVDEDKIVNPTNREVYIRLDGENAVLAPNSALRF